MILSPTPSRAPVAAPADEIALSVRDLVIEVLTPGGPVVVVDGVSFDVPRGRTLGIVGESGSGKSLTMLSIMGLLTSSAVRVRSGQAFLGGRDLLRMSARAITAIRGREIAMIFQDPMTSLNPVLRIGTQIAEMIRLHNPGLSRRRIVERSVELLALVGVPEPERRLRQYPHEFSGGMRQRAMIAMAVANNPALLIADEPTTALDVTIQAQVMEVLARVRERTGMAMVLVTHDLGLVAENADAVAVLYGGRLMEHADVHRLFATPAHPYTIGLLRSLPRYDQTVETLYAVPGTPPSVGEHPAGCVFHPRCGLGRARARCRTEVPAVRDVGGGHLCGCHFPTEVAEWERRGAGFEAEAPGEADEPAGPDAPEALP